MSTVGESLKKRANESEEIGNRNLYPEVTILSTNREDKSSDSHSSSPPCSTSDFEICFPVSRTLSSIQTTHNEDQCSGKRSRTSNADKITSCHESERSGKRNSSSDINILTTNNEDQLPGKRSRISGIDKPTANREDESSDSHISSPPCSTSDFEICFPVSRTLSSIPTTHNEDQCSGKRSRTSNADKITSCHESERSGKRNPSPVINILTTNNEDQLPGKRSRILGIDKTTANCDDESSDSHSSSPPCSTSDFEICFPVSRTLSSIPTTHNEDQCSGKCSRTLNADKITSCHESERSDKRNPSSDINILTTNNEDQLPGKRSRTLGIDKTTANCEDESSSNRNLYPNVIILSTNHENEISDSGNSSSDIDIPITHNESRLPRKRSRTSGIDKTTVNCEDENSDNRSSSSIFSNSDTERCFSVSRSRSSNIDIVTTHNEDKHSPDIEIFSSDNRNLYPNVIIQSTNQENKSSGSHSPSSDIGKITEDECYDNYYSLPSDNDILTTYSEDERYELYHRNKVALEKMAILERERKFEQYYNQNKRNEKSIFNLPGIQFINFTHLKIKFSFKPRKVVTFVSASTKFFCTLRYIRNSWLIKSNYVPVDYKPKIYNLFYDGPRFRFTDENIETAVIEIHNYLCEWAHEHDQYRREKCKRYKKGEDVWLDTEDDELFVSEEDRQNRRKKIVSIWERMLPP